MHNQDTAKDDFLESLFDIVNKTLDYFKKKMENQTEENSISNEDKIEEFTGNIQSIIDNSDNEKTKAVAKTLLEKPVESMEIMRELMNNKLQEESLEITKTLNGINQDLELLKSKSKDNPLDLETKNTVTININELNINSDSLNKKISTLLTKYKENNLNTNVISNILDIQKADINFDSPTISQKEKESNILREEFANQFYSIKELTKNDTKGVLISLNHEKNSDMIRIEYSFRNDDRSGHFENAKLNILDYAPMINERQMNGEQTNDLYDSKYQYTSSQLNAAKEMLIEKGFSKEDAKKFVLNEFKEVGLLNSKTNSDLLKNVEHSKVISNESELEPKSEKTKKKVQQKELTMER